jgi:hypothetical protein
MSQDTLYYRSSTYRYCRIIVIPVISLIPANSVNISVELRNSDLLTSASIVAPAASTGAEEEPPSAGSGGSTLGGELIMDKNLSQFEFLEAFQGNVNHRTGRKADKWEKAKGTSPQPIMYCLAVPTLWNRRLKKCIPSRIGRRRCGHGATALYSTNWHIPHCPCNAPGVQ